MPGEKYLSKASGLCFADVCWRRFGLLLDGFFHADGVHDQLKLLQDLGLVALDVTVDRLVGQQLGQVALGDHQLSRSEP
jgi:hypothetical protein